MRWNGEPPVIRSRLIAAFGVELLAFAFLVFALADLEAHRREAMAGLNQWGYRGSARAAREPREIRVAILGGSSAFEAGMAYQDTLAAQLFYELRQYGAPRDQPYSVVNLS